MNKIIALSLILCFLFCGCDSSILIGDKAEQTTVAVSQTDTASETDTVSEYDRLVSFTGHPDYSTYINENNIRFTLSYQQEVIGNTFLLPLHYNISDFDVFKTFTGKTLIDKIRQDAEIVANGGTATIDNSTSSSAEDKYYLSANVDDETFLIELTKEQSEEILAHASLNNTVVLAFTVTHVSAYTEDTPGCRLVEGTLTDVYFLAD